MPGFPPQNNPHPTKTSRIARSEHPDSKEPALVETDEPFTHVGRQHTTPATKGHRGARKVFLIHRKVIFTWQQPPMTKRAPWCNQHESASLSGLGPGFHLKSAEDPMLMETISLESPRSQSKPSSSRSHRTHDPVKFTLVGTTSSAHQGTMRGATASTILGAIPRSASGLRPECWATSIREWTAATRQYRPCCMVSASNCPVKTRYKRR